MSKAPTLIKKFANCDLIQEDGAGCLYYVVLSAAGALFSSPSLVKAYRYAEWFQSKAA